MAVKAVFFDIDGTLVDSNEYHITAWEIAFREAGFPIARDVIHGQIGKGGDMLLPTLLPQADNKTREAIEARHGEIFKGSYLKQVKAFPRATDLIRALHTSGLKIILASSAKGDEVEHYVQLLQAQRLLDGTTSADDVEKSKPAADIFASALGKVRPIPPGETMAVGDTPYDVSAAGKCGIRTIALRSGGFSDEALKQAGAIAIYTDVSLLLDSLDASPLLAKDPV